MARNIAYKPHPTPNPDQPHSSGFPADREIDPAPAHGSTIQDEFATEGPSYDSCHDDLEQSLSRSIEQPDPDPNLESPPTAHPIRSEPAPPLLPGRGNPPRTSEIFRSLGAAAVGAAGPETSSSLVLDPESLPAPEPGDQPALAAAGEDFPILDRERPIPALEAEGEEHLSEPRLSWSHLLLLSYSSAITLALVWMLWAGRGSRIAGPPPGAASPAQADPLTRPSERDRPIPAPPIPPEQLATLGQTIRLGDLEITPLAVVATPLELIRSIEPGEHRREDGECLVLRLRLTNVSKRHSFTPLDADLVRERGLRAYDPFIAVSGGPNLRLYPLAIESEWSILGQEFPKLDPGDTAETIIAAEPGSGSRLGEETTWRVHLRTGVYRSDLLGVRFTKDQVRHVEPRDEAARESSP